MKVKRDKTVAPLAAIPSSTQEQYDNAEAVRRAKFIRDRKMKALYTIRNLMSEIGMHEFLSLVGEAHNGVPEFRDDDRDTASRMELVRLARALDAHLPHPSGKPVFISLRMTPDELRAIAKWHDDTNTRKATYAEVSQFARVVLDENLKELLDTLRPVLPPKIRRRRLP